MAWKTSMAEILLSLLSVLFFFSIPADYVRGSITHCIVTQHLIFRAEAKTTRSSFHMHRSRLVLILVHGGLYGLQNNISYCYWSCLYIRTRGYKTLLLMTLHTSVTGHREINWKQAGSFLPVGQFP